MANQETSSERRSRLLPILTKAFIDLGYRRATTAELAKRCGLRENELYRIWKNKKAMFIDAVQQVYDNTMKDWSKLADAEDSSSMAERVLAHQASNHGRMRFYRIVFAGLQETDDVEIRAALRDLYRKFHKSVVEMLVQHHAGSNPDNAQDTQEEVESRAESAAWALIGLGAIVDIDRSVKLTSADRRQELIETIGKTLLKFPASTTASTL